MATVQNENSGTGVIIGILIAVLLAVGAYFLIQSQDNLSDTPVAAGTPTVNVDATVNPIVPPAPADVVPDVNIDTPDVNVDLDDDGSSTTSTEVDNDGSTTTTTTTTP